MHCGAPDARDEVEPSSAVKTSATPVGEAPRRMKGASTNRDDATAIANFETVLVYLWRRRDDPEFLLLRRTPDRGAFWQGVSGHVESGESPAAAAVREVREETGLSIAAVDGPLDQYRFEPASEPRGNACPRRVALEWVFAAEAPDNWGPELDEHEHDCARWCSFEVSRRLLHWENNVRALERLFLLIGFSRSRRGTSRGQD
jgi:dATP pyrophosphohydrolase